MAIPIQLKRNGTAASTPSSLLHGEVALNYADGKLFWKDASNVIQSFTFQSYALASHTHAASDITSGTFDAARLPLATTGAAGAVIVGTGLGVSSGTLSVTYGTSAGTACQGNDSRLSDTRTPTDGSVTTAKIANDAVTYAKLQNVSTTDRLLGRSSAGAGDVEEVTCTAFGRSLIDDADAAAARSTLSVQPTASPAFTGNATITASSGIPLTLNGNSTALRIEEGSGETIDIYRAASDGLLYLDANQQTFSGFVFRTTPTDGSITSALMIGSSQRVTLYNQLLVTAGSASAPGVAFSGDTNTGMFSPGADQLALSTNQTERLLIDASGNIRINGAAAATSAVGAIHLKNGTAPTASITDGVVLFAADVSSFSELRVRDEAGNTTTLSPHAFPLIPEGPSEPMAWAYYSERDGRRINVDMLRVVRLLEQLTGEKLVYEE